MFTPKTRDGVIPVLLVLPASLLVVIFLAGPLLLLARVSLFLPASGRGFYRPGTWTAGNFTDLASDPYFREVLIFTLLFAVSTTIIVLLIAYPLALFIHGLPPRRKAVALALVAIPKLTNVLVSIYGLQALLSGAGPVNGALLAIGLVGEPLSLKRNLIGTIVGEAHVLLPYAVLLLVAALAPLDPSLIGAARGLGASPWQAFRRVTLPLSAPGLYATGQLTLVWASGAFVGPLLLGGPGEITLAVEIHRQAVENNRWPRGAATAVVMMALVAFVLSLVAVLHRRTRREDR